MSDPNRFPQVPRQGRMSDHVLPDALTIARKNQSKVRGARNLLEMIAGTGFVLSQALVKIIPHHDEHHCAGVKFVPREFRESQVIGKLRSGDPYAVYEPIVG